MVIHDDDRRNDVGTKIILAVYSSVVAILLGLFVHAAWNQAKTGEDKAQTALDNQGKIEERLARLETYYASFNDDLKEIKLLLRRQVSR